MRELQRKQKIKQRLYSTPVLLGAFILTFLLVRGAFSVMLKEYQSLQDVVALESKAAELSSQETKLTQEINKLNTTTGINEEIKSKFNVSEEGEHVAVIVDPTQTDSASSTNAKSWYKRMWNAILSAL